MPDGNIVPIDHLPLDESKETLGVWTCPAGRAKPRSRLDKDPDSQIEAMQDKAQKWIDDASKGYLSRRDVWFLMDHQLWLKVGYGLCSVIAPWWDLDGCLKGKWWQIVPRGGLVRSAPSRIRDMSLGFYGTGCPHVGVECLIAQVGKLLVHYGCSSNNGFALKMSLKLLVV